MGATRARRCGPAWTTNAATFAFLVLRRSRTSIGQGGDRRHPNQQRFRDGYAAFQRGDPDKLRNDFFTEDIVWHSPGRNPLSGDYRGTDEVIRAMGELAQTTGGNFSLEIHDSSRTTSMRS